MRLTIASLRRVVKGDLAIQFVPQALTSYGGLELLRRYLRRIDLTARLRQAFAGLPSDYGSVRVALVLLALFYAGARRLEHLRFLSGDPLVTRFCGLARLPTRRTVANWLRQFTQETLAPLVALNRDLVTEALARLDLPRVTIDVDGSVIRTGATVGWAFRGFNPHHRKDPSYYPLLAHVAQTGHILRLKNRPGNVHDSKQAVPFVREVIDDLRRQLGRRVALEFRMDAAFFQRGILHLLAARDCGYAIKVGYWSWLPLKAIAAACRRWDAGRAGRHRPRDRAGRLAVERPAAPRGPLPEARRPRDAPELPAGSLHARRRPLRVLRRRHEPRAGPAALWAFACGRGAQEKTIAELKGEYALDVVPTKHYAANSAWQQLGILAHNLIRSFQLDTLAEPKPRSRKRTYAYVFRSLRTLRFLLIARAGRLTRLGGRNVLRLTENPATEALYGQVAHRLAA